MNLNLSTEAFNQITEHAKAAYPNECCGFFFGSDSEGENRNIEIATPVVNSKEGDQRRRFEISPRGYMQAEMYALQNNLTLLGVYHSHPDHPARPSEHDLRQAVPFFSYIIVSIKQGEVDDITSWILNDDSQFVQEIIADTHHVKL